MSIEFATDDWIQALKAGLNSSEGYKKAAKNWEGDFYFIINSEPGVYEEDVYLYMDLWHGECRDAYLVTDPAAKTPAFTLKAPLKAWQDVLSKKMDPIRGMMSGKLKLTGPMIKIMKTPKAAIELVECATQIETDWP